jgi:hypothetical protein
MSLADPTSWLIIAGVALSLCAVASLSWRTVLFLLMIWLVVEGQVRKALPGQPPQTMLVTDGLLLLVYASFFPRLIARCMHLNKPAWRPPFWGALLAFSAVCVLQVFNPSSPSLWIGLAGLHSYIWPVPLLWVGYSAFEDRAMARRFILWLVVSSVPLAILALHQYLSFNSLPGTLMPLRADFALHSNLESGEDLIRLVPSAFVNAEKFARYCLMTFFLSAGLAMDEQAKRSYRVTAAVALTASLAGIFFSGRRSPLYMSLFGLGWLMLRVFRRGRRARTAHGLAVAVSAGLMLLTVTHVSKIDATWYDDSTAEIPYRLRLAWLDIQDSIRQTGLVGLGTGTDSQGVDYVPGGESWATTSDISPVGKWGEAGLAKIWAELGLAGAATFTFLILSMGVSWYRKLHLIRGKPTNSVAAALCVFFSMMLVWFAKGHQIMGDPITLIHCWFLMGVFFALPIRTGGETSPAPGHAVAG